MVQAILKGRKTQTRRVVRPQFKRLHGTCTDGSLETERLFRRGDQRIHCPYGIIGDTLWVRETWAVNRKWNNRHCPAFVLGPVPSRPKVVFAADGDKPTAYGRWRPSIYMPRWACRLFLTLKAVRVECLQDIDRKDKYDQHIDGGAWAEGFRCPNGTAAFMEHWEKLNAKRGYSWASNPWVWVLTFEVKGGGK